MPRSSSPYSLPPDVIPGAAAACRGPPASAAEVPTAIRVAPTATDATCTATAWSIAVGCAATTAACNVMTSTILVVRQQLQHRVPQHGFVRRLLRGQLPVRLPKRGALWGPCRPGKHHRLHQCHELCCRMPWLMPGFLHQRRWSLRCDMSPRVVPDFMRQWPLGVRFLLGKGALTR